MDTLQVDKAFLVRDDIEVRLFSHFDGLLMFNINFNDITLVLNMKNMLAIEGGEVVTLHRYNVSGKSLYV